jgi:hypothetical protein
VPLNDGVFGFVHSIETLLPVSNVWTPVTGAGAVVARTVTPCAKCPCPSVANRAKEYPTPGDSFVAVTECWRRDTDATRVPAVGEVGAAEPRATRTTVAVNDAEAGFVQDSAMVDDERVLAVTCRTTPGVLSGVAAGAGVAPMTTNIGTLARPSRRA